MTGAVMIIESMSWQKEEIDVKKSWKTTMEEACLLAVVLVVVLVVGNR